MGRARRRIVTPAHGEVVAVIANARLTGRDRSDPFGTALVDLHLHDLNDVLVRDELSNRVE